VAEDDFADPTEEHDELRRTVRSMLERHSSEADVRRLMATETGQDPALWGRFADAGLLGLAVPEEYGGSGFGWLEAGLVAEEAGRALTCAPLLSSSVLATATLLHCADEAIAKELLPALTAGTKTATLAFAEDGGDWDPARTELVATCGDADDWVLDGHKSFVIDGHTAHLVLVVARTGSDTVGVFAVEAGAVGLVRSPLPTLDLTRKQARLEFAGTPGRLLNADASGGLALALDITAAVLAAEQLGGATRALEQAVEYAGLRYQFGRPIGSFQAIKHVCADMLVDVEFARSAVLHALWAADHDYEELPLAAALAQAYCSDAFVRVAGQNLQVHGGIGFTWEHPAHLYLKRAKSSQLMFGDAVRHRARLAELIPV
jgi:alkylation response protein AidB-like acyl-CoA dehydrogenase